MIADKLKCCFSETKSLAYQEKNPWLPRKKIPGFPENKSLASQDPIPGFPGKKSPTQKNEKSIFFF